MNCHGCGVELDPSQAQVNKSRSTLPSTRFWRPFLRMRKRKGECVRFWGHSKEVLTRIAGPSSLVCCWPVCSLASTWGSESRDRDGPTVQHWQGEAVARTGTNAEVVRLIGKPITIESGPNKTKPDGKKRILTIPVQGPTRWGDGTRGRRQGRALGLSRHSRRVLARCGGYALLNASNIAMLTGECPSY